MKIVTLVLAGGEGTRLYPLTAEHAKPALPFASGYRIVDFVLSNLVNSKLSTIYVLAQYKPESLVKHIQAAWAPLFSEEGRIKVLLPPTNVLGGQFKGTADAVYQHLNLIRAHSPDLVAVFAADHVYRMDVRQMIDFHRARRAEVCVAACGVPIEQAASFGILSTTPAGRVQAFREKPRAGAPSILGDSRRAYASMGNYLFDPEVLERVLEEGRSGGRTDFGRDILPRICASHRVYAYDFAQNQIPGVQEFEERSYWRDVGTLSALAAAQHDARGQKPRFNLWNSRWPIHGEPRVQLPLSRVA
ncbi:MAG TPA: sugar phosphate nucleotidyltransferase [Burkholderiales bacterium]|nr:sugar phosphate nucleotidyltransferase [Burkholderiales bacterium]